MCSHVHLAEEGTLAFMNFIKEFGDPHKNEKLN